MKRTLEYIDMDNKELQDQGQEPNRLQIESVKRKVNHNTGERYIQVIIYNRERSVMIKPAANINGYRIDAGQEVKDFLKLTAERFKLWLHDKHPLFSYEELDQRRRRSKIYKPTN